MSDFRDYTSKWPPDKREDNFPIADNPPRTRGFDIQPVWMSASPRYEPIEKPRACQFREVLKG